MSARLDKTQFRFVVVGGPAVPYSRNVFYGYRVEDIASWCEVSVDRATAFKDETKRPTKQEMKLFRLHASGRVLDPRYWPEGWKFRRNFLCDPEGNETTQRQLRAYSAVWQLACELANRSNDSNVVQFLNSVIERAQEVKLSKQGVQSADSVSSAAKLSPMGSGESAKGDLKTVA